MDLNEKALFVQRNTVEVVSLDELRELFSLKKHPVVYCGYEPSGPIHLGHLVTLKKLAGLEKVGFKVKILLADWHAFLNQKGSWEQIHLIALDWKKSIKKLGLNSAEFVFGSSFQMQKEYFEDVLNLSLHCTMHRGLRSMQEIARNIENAHVSQIIYPLMQIADIKHLKVDAALAGLEQRKIHMLSRELLPEIGYKKPVLVHTPLISSLTGKGKMSSSLPETFISVNDSSQEIEKKIVKAFCPEGTVENNPVLQIARLIVFPHFEKIEIKRPAKFGGIKEFFSFAELETDFLQKKIHPMDLKKTVSELLCQMLAK